MLYRIVIEFDGKEYVYGVYENRDRANEIALQIRETRKCEAWVEEA